MTNPGGDSSETPASDSGSGASEPSSAAYESPADRASRQPQSDAVDQSRRRLRPPSSSRRPGYTPPSSGYEAPPSYQPPHRLSAARLCTPGLPAAPACLSVAADLSGAERPAAELPAAVLRPVRLRPAARFRRPVLPPAAATAIRRRAWLSATAVVVSGGRVPRWLLGRLRAAAARNQPVRDLVAGVLADRHPVRHRFDRRDRARRRWP